MQRKLRKDSISHSMNKCFSTNHNLITTFTLSKTCQGLLFLFFQENAEISKTHQLAPKQSKWVSTSGKRKSMSV